LTKRGSTCPFAPVGSTHGAAPVAVRERALGQVTAVCQWLSHKPDACFEHGADAQLCPGDPRTEPVVSGREGARTLTGAPGIVLSARTGRPVRVDDLPARR
jgi:hypothetical protein